MARLGVNCSSWKTSQTKISFAKSIEEFKRSETRPVKPGTTLHEAVTELQRMRPRRRASTVLPPFHRQKTDLNDATSCILAASSLLKPTHIPESIGPERNLKNMPASSRTTFAKRQKERARQEKRAEKLQRRAERKQLSDTDADAPKAQPVADLVVTHNEDGEPRGFDFHDFGK